MLQKTWAPVQGWRITCEGDPNLREGRASERGRTATLGTGTQEAGVTQRPASNIPLNGRPKIPNTGARRIRGLRQNVRRE